MSRAPLSILALIALALSCEAPRAARDVATLPDGSPLAGRLASGGEARAPSLEAQIPWSNAATLWGWGAVRLWAHPREDELRVHAIVDAPAGARRWGAVCEIQLRADGKPLRLTASYVGRAMSSGQYDAVRLDVPIESVRALARAERVEGRICGDAFELGREQRETLGRFVERFDALTAPVEMPRGAPASVGPEAWVPPELAGSWDVAT